jgi:hypothetical protein
MSSTRRRTLTAALSALAVLVTGAAIAWACTPQARITTDVGQGQPGTRVVVTGELFADGGPVTITWYGGAALSTATGPSFSVPVTIPNAPADTHTIVAVGRNPNGTEAGRARASFTIPGVEPTPSDTATGGGGSTGSSSGTATGGDRAARGSTGATANARERVVRGGEAVGRSGAGVSADAPLATSDSVFADSTVQSQGTGAAAVAARRAGSNAAAPSERSAAANLWGGFERNSPPSLGSIAGESENGSIPGLALALLVLGVGAVLAGAAVVGGRRRRARAY